MYGSSCSQSFERGAVGKVDQQQAADHRTAVVGEQRAGGWRGCCRPTAVPIAPGEAPFIANGMSSSAANGVTSKPADRATDTARFRYTSITDQRSNHQPVAAMQTEYALDTLKADGVILMTNDGDR